MSLGKWITSIVGVVFLIVLASAVYSLYQYNKTASYSRAPQSSQTTAPSKTPTSSNTTDLVSPPTILFKDIENWIGIKVFWQEISPETQNIAGFNYSGFEISGNLVSQNGNVQTQEKQPLLAQGWKEDINLAAGGPTGNGWGYTKKAENELLYFSYQNTSFIPPPGQTTCPCNINLKVFYTNQYK